MKEISNSLKKNIFLDDIPGASQRLPVNAAGQLQINPAPKGAHCPPLRPSTE